MSGADVLKEAASDLHFSLWVFDSTHLEYCLLLCISFCCTSGYILCVLHHE